MFQTGSFCMSTTLVCVTFECVTRVLTHTHRLWECTARI